LPHAPHSPPLAFADIDEIAAELRRRGGRFSAARRAVLEALFAAKEPVSAEFVAGGLGGKRPKLELTSVYRTLESLEEIGAVRHLHVGHGPGLYVLTGGESHEYLVCESCGRVTTVPSSELDSLRRQIDKRFGLQPRFSHFPMFGLCADCQGRPRRAAG
jgi:Fur family ferric uptake transcriptional regulator